jgi:hypothetical protein
MINDHAYFCGALESVIEERKVVHFDFLSFEKEIIYQRGSRTDEQ